MSDRVNLPPCPDCGQSVDDIHVQDILTTRVERPPYGQMPKVVAVDASARRTRLLPCQCSVRFFELRAIRGQQRLIKLVMASGWKWELGWEGVEIQIIEPETPGLTPGQTPG